MHTIAAQLLGSGASINDTMSDGQTLLHMAIRRQDSKSALFLLEHQADINIRYGSCLLITVCVLAFTILKALLDLQYMHRYTTIVVKG